METEVAHLNDQVLGLKEKDQMHLEEIKRYLNVCHLGTIADKVCRLLIEKVDVQTAGLRRSEHLIERERESGCGVSLFRTEGPFP